MKLPATAYRFFSMFGKSLYVRMFSCGCMGVVCLVFIALLPSLAHAELQVHLTPGGGGAVQPYQGEYHPFGKKRPKPQTDRVLQRKINRVTSTKQKSIHIEAPVTYSGRPVDPQKDTDLTPRRTTFPGKSDTLSQMDEESPSQLNVYYKLDEQATAHMAINEQNMESPTYAPIKKDEGVNAAGMYLNVDVQENVKLKVGGEVRSHETVSNDHDDQSSAGAQIGLQWNF